MDSINFFQTEDIDGTDVLINCSQINYMAASIASEQECYILYFSGGSFMILSAEAKVDLCDYIKKLGGRFGG